MKNTILAIAVAIMATMSATARTVSIDLRGDSARIKGARATLPEGTLRRVNLDAGAADIDADRIFFHGQPPF